VKVANFNCLGKAVTNESFVQEEIRAGKILGVLLQFRSPLVPRVFCKI